MSGSTVLVRDPTGERRLPKWELAPRPEDLKDLTVGLVSNGWRSFDIVLERFEILLKERQGVGGILHFQKEADVRFARLSRPMAKSMLEEVTAKCDVAIVGLGG